MGSFSGLSQTEKGDFVITPTLGWSTVSNGNINIDPRIFRARFPVGFHKYLSQRFAVGSVLDLSYSSYKYTNEDEVKGGSVSIIPEVRYNFLKKRFTPFVAGRFFSVGYRDVSYDYPSNSTANKKVSELYYYTNARIDVGLSYFIKNRFGIQIKLVDINFEEFNQLEVDFPNPINFGLQFIINNPRSEIESLR